MGVDRPRSILVVDDDENIAGLWAAALEDAGFRVRTAGDGATALALAESEPFGLAIVDLHLPKPTGFELVEKWKPSAKLEILVVSGVFRDERTRARLARLGVGGMLEKPIDPSLLVDRAREVLGAPRRRSTGSFSRVVLNKRPAEVGPWPEAGEVDEAGRRTGRLGLGGFASVFGTLHRQDFSGVLLVWRASVKKMLHLKDGVPVLVRSNLLAECLGRRMIDDRLISETACARALELKKRTGKRFGETLVEMGEISEQNLDFALEQQMHAKLMELFSWREGQYRAITGSDTPSELRLDKHPAALIYEGLTRGMEPGDLLSAVHAVRRHKLAPFEREDSRALAAELDPETWRILQSASGQDIESFLDGDAPTRPARARLLLALGLTGHLPLRTPRPEAHEAGGRALGRGLPPLEAAPARPSRQQEPARLWGPVRPTDRARKQDIPLPEAPKPSNELPPRGLTFGQPIRPVEQTFDGDAPSEEARPTGGPPLEGDPPTASEPVQADTEEDARLADLKPIGAEEANPAVSESYIPPSAPLEPHPEATLEKALSVRPEGGAEASSPPDHVDARDSAGPKGEGPAPETTSAITDGRPEAPPEAEAQSQKGVLSPVPPAPSSEDAAVGGILPPMPSVEAIGSVTASAAASEEGSGGVSKFAAPREAVIETVPSSDVVSSATGEVAPSSDVIFSDTGEVAQSSDVVSFDTGEVAPTSDVVSSDADEVAPSSDEVSFDAAEMAPSSDVVSFDAAEMAPSSDVVSSDTGEVAQSSDVVFSDADEVAQSSEVVSFDAAELAPSSDVASVDAAEMSPASTVAPEGGADRISESTAGSEAADREEPAGPVSEDTGPDGWSGVAARPAGDVISESSSPSEKASEEASAVDAPGEARPQSFLETLFAEAVGGLPPVEPPYTVESRLPGSIGGVPEEAATVESEVPSLTEPLPFISEDETPSELSLPSPESLAEAQADSEDHVDPVAPAPLPRVLEEASTARDAPILSEDALRQLAAEIPAEILPLLPFDVHDDTPSAELVPDLAPAAEVSPHDLRTEAAAWAGTASERAPSNSSPTTSDLEDEAITFARLQERYEAVAGVGIHERLGLEDGPLIDATFIDEAFAEAELRLAEEVGEAARISGRSAHLAEAAWVALDDARSDLLHPDLRRRAGEGEPPPPAWLDALRAFEVGLRRAREGDADGAFGAFSRAAELEPSVAEYRAHAEACRPGAPVSSLLPALLIRARAVDPGTPQGQNAWRAVLEADKDNPEALKALRPEQERPGIFRRLRGG